MADVNLLRSLGSIKHFAKDDTVFCQNEAGTDMYIVLKGTFGVYINSLMDFPVRVAAIGVNSFFGEMAALDGSVRSATVIAEEDSTVIVIAQENFEMLLEKSPEIAAAIMETLRIRLIDTAAAVKEAGISIRELSPVLNTVKFENAATGLTYMRVMSSKIREMNELLSATPEVHWVSKSKKKNDIISLLPPDYKTLGNPGVPHDADCLRRITFVCPYCFAETMTYIPLISGLVKLKDYPDGRVTYRNLDVLRYTNVVCGNCNYCDTYIEYSKPKSYKGTPRYHKNQFPNTEGFTGYKDQKNRTLDETVMSYCLNLECLKWVTKDPLRYGKAWIRLYWIYGDNGCTIQARRAAQRAHHYYSQFLKASSRALSEDEKTTVDNILKETAVYLNNAVVL